METKVQCKSFLPGYHLMGDLNDDSSIGTWPVYYGDKPSSNAQFHDPHLRRKIADAYFGYHTETVRQKMLEHEATFKTQLYELHRLYRVQIELMDDLKMNELQKQSMAIDTSISSCSASQRQDAQRWLTSSAFPLSSSSSAKLAGLGGKDFHSTPKNLSGKSAPNYLGSPNNAASLKDCEVEILECRPSKVRRKFNLELRADEYIDVEEPKSYPIKLPGVSSYTFNGSCEDPPSSSTKMLLSRSIKIGSRGDEARQSKGENGLADLNEQIQIPGMNSSSFNFVGCDSNFRSKPQLQTLPRDYMQNSHWGHDDSRSRNLTIALKENGKGWSHMLDSARSKGQTTVFSQNLLPENINFFNKGQDESFFQTNQIKAEYWKEGSEGGPKQSGNGFFNRLSNSHQLDKAFSTSKAPWEKSGSCVTQKSVTAERHPCFNSTSTLSRSLQPSSKSPWTLGEACHINSGSGIDAANQNGFYKGSCSGSGPAHRPTTGFDYSNRSNGSCAASGVSFFQNGSMNLKGLTSADASSARGIDLNLTSIGDNHDYVDRSNRDRAAELPWLKSSTGAKNGTERIMGVPIFRESHISKGASSCRSKEEEMDKNGRVRGFDMNLPGDYDEKDTETPVVSGRSPIDLNLSLAEDDAVKSIRGFDLEAPGDIEEDDVIQPENSDEDVVKVAAEAIVEISCYRKLTLTESPGRNPPEGRSDALEWLVGIISSCSGDMDKESPGRNEEESDLMDYFEYMTLQLPETAKEEYLPDYPKPPEPEEHTGAGPYTTRTRKGQARRGRPRRDFQRDILPGLTSLARHEVTEDLQTFGGLMRAMGHSWQTSLTRRAGPRRGRPRSTPVQPPYLASPLPPKKPEAAPGPACSPSPQKTTTSAMNMEDHGSLTGWGKTTRRPRRQRFPAINASALHIA